MLTAVTAEALAQAGSELDHARSEAAAVCDAAEVGLVDDLVNTQLDHPAKPL